MPVKPKVRLLFEIEPVMLVSLVVVVTTIEPREIWVAVPISTFSPPVIARLLPTVKEAKEVVPVPPEETERGLVKVIEVKEGVADTAMVEVPVIEMLEP